MISSACRVKAMTCRISGCSCVTQVANQTTDGSCWLYMSADHNAKQSVDIQMSATAILDLIGWPIDCILTQTAHSGDKSHLLLSYPATTQTLGPHKRHEPWLWPKHLSVLSGHQTKKQQQNNNNKKATTKKTIYQNRCMLNWELGSCPFSSLHALHSNCANEHITLSPAKTAFAENPGLKARDHLYCLCVYSCGTRVRATTKPCLSKHV